MSAEPEGELELKGRRQNLTVRKDEWSSVVDILESEEYEDAQSTAKAIVGALFDKWRARDWFAVAPKGYRGHIMYGLEASEAAAKKTAKAMGLEEASVVSQVRSVENLMDVWDEQDAEAMRRFGPPPVCAKCGHLREHHGVIGFKGRPVQAKKASQRCWINCTCDGYERGDTL